MAEHTLNINAKIQQSAMGGIAERFQDRQFFRERLAEVSEYTKLATALTMTTRAVNAMKKAIELIPDTVQNAGLRAGAEATMRMIGTASQTAATSARVGRYFGQYGGLLGGLIGLGVGGYSELRQIEAEDDRREKMLREQERKRRREESKKRAKLLYEGELLSFRDIGRAEQIETLREWKGEVEKAAANELEARRNLASGGSVEVYEMFKEKLDAARHRLEAAALMVKGNADRTTFNFMDDMSKMGLYMNGRFASVGGGNVELDVLKEQKSLLEKIESNTRDISEGATYA